MSYRQKDKLEIAAALNEQMRIGHVSIELDAYGDPDATYSKFAKAALAQVIAKCDSFPMICHIDNAAHHMDVVRVAQMIRSDMAGERLDADDLHYMYSFTASYVQERAFAELENEEIFDKKELHAILKQHPDWGGLNTQWEREYIAGRAEFDADLHDDVRERVADMRKAG